jgi:transposase
MRQTHIGGEKVFVDFAGGDTFDIFDPITGEVHAMNLFVAAMGASNYTYAVACPSESLQPVQVSRRCAEVRGLR